MKAILLKPLAAYILSILKGIFWLKYGTLSLKIKASLKLGFYLSIWPVLAEKVTHWALTNQEYVTFTFVAIGIDHILGTIKHAYILKDFSAKNNIKGLMLKSGLVLCVGLLFEGLPVIMKTDSFIVGYITTVLRLMVFLYPAGSAFVNSSILSGGKFPPKAWIQRISKFQENLKVEDLTNKNNENEQS